MATNKGIYGVDRWIGGARVVASDIDPTVGRFGGTLRISAGGTLNATISGAERWWLYYNPFSNTEEQNFHADWPSLYFGLAVSLSSAAGGVFTVGGYTLAGSATPKTGLWINWDGGVWSIDWDNTNMNPEWFGFPRDITGTTTSDSAGTIYSEKSIRNVWVSNSLNMGRASMKLPIKKRMSGFSSNRSTEAYASPYNEEFHRKFQYRYCPEVTVYGELIDSTPDANIAQVAPGDNFNCFLPVWDYMSAGNEVIIVHNRGDEDLKVVGKQYEVAVLDLTQREDSESVIQGSGIAGRFYDLNPIVARLEGTYGALTD